MRVGITGHQDRSGIDWSWVADTMRDKLSEFSKLVGYSSLAQGADQVFAEVILEIGGDLNFVRPIAHYEETLEAEHLTRFLRLETAASRTIVMPETESDQDGYLAAGKYIAARSDLLVAVWDGKPAGGKGGTADIVTFAKERKAAVFHIEPIARTVREL